MQPRRVRFTIRGLMIAVLVAAVLLSMPIRDLIVLIVCTTVLAIMFCFAYRVAIMTHGWRVSLCDVRRWISGSRSGR